MAIIIKGKTIWGPSAPSTSFIVGYNTIGSTLEVYTFDSGVACKFTPGADGTITDGYAYLVDNDYPGIPGINNSMIAIYSNSSTVPLNLLAYSTQQSPIGSYSWVHFTTFIENVAGGLTLTSGVPIWIAVWSNAYGIIRGARDAGSVGQYSENTALTFTWPTWGTWNNVSLTDYNLSIYLELSTLDADAISFLTVTGITDSTIRSAIITLVSNLKSNSLWTKIKAFYPFVGGSATTHKYNLKDPQDTDAAFRLTMVGGLTHDSNGVTGNGSTGYMDPHFADANFNGQDDAGFLVYCRNNFSAGAKGLYGAVDSAFSGSRFLPNLGSIAYKSIFSGTGAGIANTDTSGLWVHTRTGPSAEKIYRNGTLFQAQNFASQTNTTTASILILAVDYDNGALKYQQADANICTFAFTDGLDDADKATLSTIVNTFNTTLSRNIY